MVLKITKNVSYTGWTQYSLLLAMTVAYIAGSYMFTTDSLLY